MIPETLTTYEVARKLGVSDRTVVNYIKSGSLQAYRFGRAYKIPVDSLEEFIEKAIVLGGQEHDTEHTESGLDKGNRTGRCNAD